VRCPAGADPRLSAWGTALELAGLGLQVREPRVPYDGQIRSDFKMQRFESCRLELRVLAIPILECRCSNPAASASQSVSNASHMKVAQKPRGTARFRRYELVSVCGIWQWRRHSCLLSQRAFFGVSFLLCAKLYRLRVESTTPKEKGRGAAAFLQLDGFREVHARGCGGRMP
jgi:hypothetical protein